MKISTSDMKVRATELLPVTMRGAKATFLTLRRWYKKFRATYRGETGKTGDATKLRIDRSSTNLENEINESRDVAGTYERKIQGINENDLRNITNENLENELREMMLMSGIEN